MKKLPFIILLLLAQSVFCQNNNEEEQEETVALEEVIVKVQEALNEIKLSGDFQGNIDVSVNFESVVTKKTEGTFKILIFKFGKGVTRTESSSMTFDFLIERTQGIVKAHDFKEKLAGAINESMKSYNQAKPSFGLLKPKKATIKVAFTIEKNTSGSGEFEILPVTLGASRSITNKSIHYVQITFNI